MTCTSHHHACQCREAEFRTLREAAAALIYLIDHHHDLDGNIHMTEQAGAVRTLIKTGPARDPNTLLKKHPRAAPVREFKEEQDSTPFGISHPQPGVLRHRIK